MFDGSLEALQILADPRFLLIVVAATTIGTIAAILPGISPGTMMALLIPATFGMDKYSAFGFLVALMAAGGFAGSMTSILLNVPGDGINAATTLDGFPMARQGKAGVAIAAAATASAIGAVFGAVVLILSIPVMRQVILAFGPPEFFALAIAGVALIATVSTRSPLKGLTAGLLGMALGFIGINYTVGGTRFTMGMLELEDGIRLVPALIGLFAIPELYNLIKRNETVSHSGEAVKGGVMKGVREVLRRPGLVLRSSVIGTFIGIMPGVGGSVASWVAYFAAQNSSKDPDSFGKGNIEGVIAPEASMNAKEGGSMVSVLALGLPASVSTAILITAFQIHGVYPGAQLFAREMTLVWVMILALVFANITTSILGLVFANQMVKITLVPAVVIAPIIFALGAIGSFADQRSLFGLFLMLAFGTLGIVMGRYGFPRPPLLVGMILLSLAETNFYRATQISRGELTWLTHPLVLIIFALIILAILLPAVRSMLKQRNANAAKMLGSDGDEESGEDELINERTWLPGQLVFTGSLFLVESMMFVATFSFTHDARIFPQIVLAPLIFLTGFLTLATLRAVIRASSEPGSRMPPMGALPWQAGFIRSLREERPDWWVFGWLLVLIACVWAFGVLVGSSLYIALFIVLFIPRVPTVRTLVIAAALSVGMYTLCHLAFEVALGVRFYGGLFA